MNIPVQNIYYLLCYAWNKLEEKDKVSISVDEDTELVDLFAKVLINSSKILLKRGFERSYIYVQDERIGVKGKLETSESLKRNTFQHLKAVCSYDEYSVDILHNQILFTTLYWQLFTDNLKSELKEQIRKLLRMFPEISMIELTPGVFQQINIHRNNRLYGFILNVCKLIYENSLPTEEAGRLTFSDFTRNEKKMATLFEEFVYRFYKIECPYLKTSRPHINWNLEAAKPEDEGYLPIMKTDIVFEKEGRKTIIDTKYYQETMSGQSDKEKIKSENLYQLFSYLLNQEDGSEDSYRTKGVLLYPTIEKEFNLRYAYGQHEIIINTVNLNTHWSNIESRLKEIAKA